MIDRLDVRFAVLADADDDSSWTEVVEQAGTLRGRRRPRRLVVIAFALALAVVVAAPAAGLRGRFVRLFGDAKPAPQRIEKSFAGWGLGAPAGLGRAIQVLQTSAGVDGKVTLWLAPVGGGFCTLLDLDSRGGGGGCERLGYDRLSVTVSLHGRVSHAGQVLSGPVLLDGYTARRQADSLLIRFEDGETTTIPLVWVSAPVDTGFFVYAVPTPHWREGHLPATLTLFSADGNELDRRQIHGIPKPGSLNSG